MQNVQANKHSNDQARAVFNNMFLKAKRSALKSELAQFIGAQQFAAIAEMTGGRHEPSTRLETVSKIIDLAEVVGSMPCTYETDGQGDQAIVHLHYFTAGADWYVTERDVETYQNQAFGMADLGFGGELGYISIVELLEAGAELDLYWTPKTLAAVKTEKILGNVNYVGNPMHY